MKKLRIAVLEYYPDVAKALQLSGNGGEKEVFYHLAIREFDNGCSVFFRSEMFAEVSQHLGGERRLESAFPRLDFQEAKAHDIIDQLRKGFVLHVDFLKAREIEFLLD